MINNKINYIWFILLMNNFLYHLNILLYISKTKKKISLFLFFNHLFLAITNYQTLFARCVLLSFIYLIFFCVSCYLSCCVYHCFFFFCVLLLMKTKNKTKTKFFSLCLLYKLSHLFFPYKDQTMF